MWRSLLSWLEQSSPTCTTLTPDGRLQPVRLLTGTTGQARSFEPSPTIHGLAAKPSERASRSERTAGTIPRLDGNTACTTPDRELNDGSSRTSAPLDKSSLASTTGGALHPLREALRDARCKSRWRSDGGCVPVRLVLLHRRQNATYALSRVSLSTASACARCP